MRMRLWMVLGSGVAAMGLGVLPAPSPQSVALAVAPKPEVHRLPQAGPPAPVEAAPIQDARPAPALSSDDPRAVALRRLRQDASRAAALALADREGLLRPAEEEPRVDVARHARGWVTVFVRQDAFAESWGVLTISPSDEVLVFRGDRSLWGVPESDPIGLLWLGEAQLLTLLERDGGSGGMEESLRVFLKGPRGWVAAGSVPLSRSWRSGRFPELCGAETPHELREVTSSVDGAELVLEGSEETIRRLPDAEDGLRLERAVTRVVERYSLRSGRLERRSRELELLRREQEAIPLR